jgi:hypothetical protein
VVRYLVLEEVVPGPAAEHEADEELEQVEREVEHDAVQPHDTGPAPADTLDPGEAPVGVHGQEGRNLHQQDRLRLGMCCCVNFQVVRRQPAGTYKLSEQESGDQEQTRALHERPATGAGDEDQSLAHNTDLEVQCRHHLVLAVPD